MLSLKRYLQAPETYDQMSPLMNAERIKAPLLLIHGEQDETPGTLPIQSERVIDSDEVNAFALPGGFFYVNKGLILAADNEAELAGVMAHEISHVIARHAVENQTKANLMQYGTLAGIILLGGIPGMVLQNTAGIGMMSAFMKFSRNAEAEADKLGTEYLYAAGYDPTALATMFEKLEAKNKKKPGTIAKIFADHPAPADRRAASLALAARFPEHEEYGSTRRNLIELRRGCCVCQTRRHQRLARFHSLRMAHPVGQL